MDLLTGALNITGNMSDACHVLDTAVEAAIRMDGYVMVVVSKMEKPSQCSPLVVFFDPTQRATEWYASVMYAVREFLTTNLSTSKV